MKNLILIYCLLVSQVFGQSINPNDQLKLGNKTSSADKGIVFETGDGVSNKKLLIEKISKKLKWDGNSVQFGDGSPTSDKELIVAGSLKSLKYNGTSGEFEFNDDLKLSGELKTDILRAINSEVAVKNYLRAELGVKFGTGDAEIKYDSGLGSLVFSNDGIFYKKVGSGGSSGGEGGTNLLLNPSFEETLTNWTLSGGTLVNETYANPVEGDLSYAKFTATTASQTVCSATTTTPSFFGAGGMTDFSYTGTGTAFIAYVKDGSGNKLTAPQALQNQTLWTKLSPIAFSFNTSQMLCFESTGAGEIKIDKAYLGSNKNVTSISQARLFGSIKYSPQAQSWSANAASWTDVPENLSISLPIASGNALAPSTRIPAIKFAFMPKGTYRFVARGTFASNVSNLYGVSRYRFSDGSETFGDSVSMGATNATVGWFASSSIEGSVSYATSQTDKTIRIQSESPSGSILLTYDTPFIIDVYYFPSEADQVQTPEAASWFIDANIGGADVQLPLASSYTEITNASLNMVLNSQSSTAQIACASGTDSTGLTCSSSESVGITFTNPSSGLYEACFSFSANRNNGSATYQVIETIPTSSAIVQEGKTRISTSAGNASTVTANPFTNCGTFYFGDTKRRTLRLMHESDDATGYVLMARNSTLGQRDLHITIRPLLQNSSRAILTGDTVRSPNVVNPKIYAFELGGALRSSPCTTSPCTVYGNKSGLVQSVTRISTGGYTITRNGGFPDFKDMFCLATVTQYSGSSMPAPYLQISPTSTTSFNISNSYATTSIDVGLAVMCITQE